MYAPRLRVKRKFQKESICRYNFCAYKTTHPSLFNNVMCLSYDSHHSRFSPVVKFAMVVISTPLD